MFTVNTMQYNIMHVILLHIVPCYILYVYSLYIYIYMCVFCKLSIHENKGITRKYRLGYLQTNCFSLKSSLTGF